MGMTNLVKEFLRIAETGALSKDVLDLLTKKANLLQEEIDRLTEENAKLRNEIEDLRKSQGDNAVKGLDEGEIAEEIFAILSILYKIPRGATIERVAAEIGMEVADAYYYFDLLTSEQLVCISSFGAGEESGEYQILPKGRNYYMRLKKESQK